MSSPRSKVRHISKCMIKPPASYVATQSCHLSLWDLSFLNNGYIQSGLLFSNLPTSLTTNDIINVLKASLSTSLVHFYPLAGRLVTEQEPNGMLLSIDCNNEGAEFVHAIAENVTVVDMLASYQGSPFIQSFFPLKGAIGYDGHSMPLLAVQVTELVDGIFLACSFNHVVGDGTSYWHFFNVWAEIARKGGNAAISHPPVHNRWFSDHPPIKLPFSHSDEFVERYVPLPYRERTFRFSSESIRRLKVRANKECDTVAISSYQALLAHVWRSVTRARQVPCDQITKCGMAINNRARMRPPLSPYYFGNSVFFISATMTAGELMANGLGSAALALNRIVAAHDDDAIQGIVKWWHGSPFVYRMSGCNKFNLMIGSSPRFEAYVCDFGWGKALALRNGAAGKLDGMISSYPGSVGGGSMDLEVCLTPEVMTALESDAEFMDVVSFEM